jgi:hypothetical protein
LLRVLLLRNGAVPSGSGSRRPLQVGSRDCLSRLHSR